MSMEELLWRMVQAYEKNNEDLYTNLDKVMEDIRKMEAEEMTAYRYKGAPAYDKETGGLAGMEGKSPQREKKK